MPENIYSTIQAAKKIGVSRITVFRWLKAGKIKPASIKLPDGRRQWRWTDADVAKAKTLKQGRGQPRKEKAK